MEKRNFKVPYILSIMELSNLVRDFFEKEAETRNAQYWTEEILVSELFQRKLVDDYTTPLCLLVQLISDPSTGELCLYDNSGKIGVLASESVLLYLNTQDQNCTSWFFIRDCEICLEVLGDGNGEAADPYNDQTKGAEVVTIGNTVSIGDVGQVIYNAYARLLDVSKLEPFHFSEPSAVPKLIQTVGRDIQLLSVGRPVHSLHQNSIGCFASLQYRDLNGNRGLVRVEDSSFPVAYGRLLEGGWYKVMHCPNSKQDHWNSSTIILPLQKSLSVHRYREQRFDSTSNGVSTLLHQAFKVRKAKQEACKKPLLERSCSFIGILEHIGLRQSMTYQLKYLPDRESVIWKSGRRFPWITQYCVVLMKVRDVCTPETIDVYLDIDKRLLQPGLFMLGGLLKFRNCTLYKSGRGKVFVKCKSSAEVMLVETHSSKIQTKENLAKSSKLLRLSQFYTNANLRCGYVMASICFINSIKLQMFCKRCSKSVSRSFGPLRCANTSCGSSELTLNASLSCVIDDGTAKAQLLAEGDSTLDLLGIDTAPELEQVKQEALLNGKLGYESSRKLAEFVNSSRSPSPWIVFVEKGVDSEDFRKKRDRDGDILDCRTTFIPFIQGIQKTLKAETPSLKAVYWVRPSYRALAFNVLEDFPDR